MPKTRKIEFAIGDARRRINERTAEAVEKYMRSKITTEPCRSKIKTVPCINARCDSEEYCDAFESEDSFAPKRSRSIEVTIDGCLYKLSTPELKETRTIETQTDLSFLSF